jgi:D-aspartate ligase
MKSSSKGQLKKYKILIFGAGGRQTLPVCKGFYDIGCEVFTYCENRLSTGFLTKYTNHKLLYNKNSGKDFYDYGAELIIKGQYDLVVPMGDKSALYLVKRKKELQKYAKIAVNDDDIFQFAIDKYLTMRIGMKNHIPVPYTLADDENVEKELADGKIRLPVVVKPKSGVGSIGFRIIDSEQELLSYLNEYDGCNGPLLIQEYIPQGDNPQFRADLFRDRDGVYKAAIVGKVTRWYPLDGGSGIHIMTVHNSDIIAYCKRLLDVINWNGYANIDIVWDERNNMPMILEINGRVGASIKQDYVAGINISQLILENELGLEVTDYTDYEEGSQVSCFLLDLLWLIKSPKRFSNHPSWFNRRGIVDTVFSLDDPLPAIGFIISSVINYKESMKKRRRE